MEEKEKIIEEYKDQINHENYEMVQLFEQIKKDKNSIKIKYHNDKNVKAIQIFGVNFVNNIKDKCKIKYNNKEYNLTNKFYVENKNQLEKELNGILNITSMYLMFYYCSNLISLPDIYLINTRNVTNMICMFYKCSSLSSLSDISKWDNENIL